MRLFKNGTIASEETPELQKADILVDDEGVIHQIAETIEAVDGSTTVDCDGCVIVPGMFDLNVHAREPGFEHKETLSSCGEAAIHGGVTGLVLMPDTAPPVDSGNLVKSLQDLVSEVSRIPMHPSGCLTKKREGRCRP